ncbi:MAG: hypothetical protein ACQETD_12720, partial [Pseudomonadota bacterium]
ILLLMLPDRDEQSVSRIASASMLMCTQALREQVAKQVLAGEAVTARFDNTCPDLIDSLTLSEEGEILIKGASHPVSMQMVPVVEGEAVRWSCRGEPEELVTKLCSP